MYWKSPDLEKNEIDKTYYSEIKVNNNIVEDVEGKFKLKFPKKFVNLYKDQNGGRLIDDCLPVDKEQWNNAYVKIKGMLPLTSLVEENEMIVLHNNYPSIGVYFAIGEDNDSAFALDYRECGENDEPKVVFVSAKEKKIINIANSFNEFLYSACGKEFFDVDYLIFEKNEELKNIKLYEKMSKQELLEEISLDPENVVAMISLAIKYEDMKDYDTAYFYTKKAVEYNYPRAINYLGYLHMMGMGAVRDFSLGYKNYLRAAHAGNAPACCNVGDCYYFGTGIEKDINEAFLWYARAAKLNYPNGIANLGYCYLTGEGTDKNKPKAMRYLEYAAAEYNLPFAQFALGKEYVLRGETEEDFKAAIKWLTKAANNNYLRAFYELAYCYHIGLGVEKDEQKAEEYYSKALELGYKGNHYTYDSRLTPKVDNESIESLIEKAKQGIPYYQNMVGYKYGTGDGVEKDYKIALEWYMKAAEQDYDAALYNVGLYYYRGYGVEIDYYKALEWMTKAAAKGDVKAYQTLGNMYHDGTPIKDLNLSFTWYQKAAEGGFSFGEYALADAYYYGYGTDVDKVKAFGWYMRAASQDHGGAMYKIGLMYNFGDGVDKNMEQAVYWYQKAAKKEVPAAICNLGLCYAFGDGIQKDRKKAFELYMKAAELGDCVAQYNVSFYYNQGDVVEQNNEKATYWLMKSAAQNYPESCYQLGWAYFKGKGIQKDVNEAVNWWMKAAEMNVIPAIVQIGYSYLNGEGVVKDTQAAMAYFMRASEAGDAQADLEIGYIYAKGLIGVPNINNALHYWDKAARKNHPTAFFNLGIANENGDGLPQDFKKAAEHFIKAGDLGFVEGYYRAGLMYYRLSNKTEAYKYFTLAKEKGFSDPELDKLLDEVRA